MMNFKNIEDQYGLNLFAKRGIIIVKGEKASVWDDTGKEYIDCTAGHGVAGFGRTGKMFACEHFDIRPDILCLSKAIAGGFPMGAVLCSEKVKISTGQHGTTFGGNPLACAVSLATLDVILKNNLVQETEEKGKYFSDKFAKYDLKIVREVRQIGLMIGIELKEKSQKYINNLQNEGIMVLAAGQLVIRLLLPLTISYEKIDIVIEKLTDVLRT